jgi:transposase
VRYLGLNPRLKQSGGQPASPAGITKQGRAHAPRNAGRGRLGRGQDPGTLRAFYERVRARRGMRIAVVATARKLAVLCTWSAAAKTTPFQRPSLTAKKLRALELQAGRPSRRGQKGSAAPYSLKEIRAREQQMAEQAERAYTKWSPTGRPNRRKRAWPPPLGRDSQGPLRGKLRGSTKPHILRFAPASTTPTRQANAATKHSRCPDPP